MSRWVGTWSQGISDHSFLQLGTQGRSLRAVVRNSLGGSAVRVRFSNRFGGQPIRMDAASVAFASEAGTIHVSSLRELRFEGQAGIRLEAGQEFLSDPVALDAPPLAWVAVSMYFAEAVLFDTANIGQGKMYYSPPGNHVMETGSFRAFSSIEEEYPLPFIAGVEVLGADSARALVAFGDSITALGYPRMLAERLNALGLTEVGVLDQGLGGNRVLYPGADELCLAYGPAGVTRFQQDVFAHAGVRYVLVLHGVNDIGHPGSVAPISETVSAQEIFSGLIKYAEWAHAQGVSIFTATLLPFGGIQDWETIESKRQELNRLILKSTAFDGIWDLDAALRDPSAPAYLLPAYDSGDHLHPGPLGLRAIAEAVEVGWFGGGLKEG